MSSPRDPFLTAALLRHQLILHLLARIGARVWLVVSPHGWADTPGRRVLLIAFVVYDVVLARWIWQERLPLWLRLVLDTLDVAFWSALCPPDAPFTAAVVIAVPLVLVIAVQRGIAAALVACAGITTVVAAVRVALGARPFVGDTLLYLAMAVFLGWILSRLLRAELHRQQTAAAEVNQADTVAAALAGRNEVITGVGREAIDDLQTSIMRLSMANVDAAMSLRGAVAEHKQRLAEETRDQAVYLRDALDAFATNRRLREPAVARYVFFDLDGNDAVQVLSRRQARQLFEQLAEADLTGELRVHVLPRRPGRPLVIEAGPAVVTLAANPDTRVRLPIAPVAMTGLALYILTMSNPNYSGVSLRLTVPLAALVLAYAAAGLLLIRRFGHDVEPWVAIGTLAPFILVCVLTAQAQAPATEPGLTLLGPLAGTGLLLGTIVRPRRAVVAAWIAMAISGIAVLLAAPPLPARHVAAEFIWPLIAFTGAHLMARAVGRLSEQLSVRLTNDGAAEVERRRGEARGLELEYLWDMLSRGEALCRRAEPGEIRNHVVADLRRIRRLLTAQTAGP
jgi:hypothetical protein